MLHFQALCACLGILPHLVGLLCPLAQVAQQVFSDCRLLRILAVERLVYRRHGGDRRLA
jgi:hypothetical protein